MLLRHPAGDEARPCALRVTRLGLHVARWSDDSPDGSGEPEVFLRWSELHGFGADRTVFIRGQVLQILELTTDAGRESRS